jgi:hypothetical protein
MKVIYDYHIRTDERMHATVTMPIGAQILTVQTPFKEPIISVIVDSRSASEDREFVVLSSEASALVRAEVDLDSLLYIGTFQTSEKSAGVTMKHAFHLFECPRKTS